MRTFDEQQVWAKTDSVAYYTHHRNRPEDLYPSEKFFLPDVLKTVGSCLDVGCAAGGFSRIMKHFNPNLHYVGADVVPDMVEAARRAYPETPFVLTDGETLPFEANAFDLVHISGVLHLNSAYLQLLAECYRVASCFVIADFRISPTGRHEIGTFDVRFDEGTSAETVLPYIVVNLDALLDFLRHQAPPPGRIQAKGYLHPPSDTAHISQQEIIMAFFLIEKGGGRDTELVIDLPPIQKA